MQRGEWWIDESGQTTFADGDVGDYNHEALAYTAALGLPLEPEGDYDGPEFQIGERIFPYHAGDLGEDPDGKPIPITPQNCLYLWVKENGAPKSALRFFGKEHADAREYAVRYMGWIRVKGANAEMWKLDDKTLHNLQSPDEIWDEEDMENEQDELYIEERSTGKTWSIPIKVVLAAQSAAGLKAWSSGARQWHRSAVDGLRGKRRRGKRSR